ncbi:MAG: hypothetical protein QXR87_06535 [Candidatus Hadarchaeales archaeon]
MQETEKLLLIMIPVVVVIFGLIGGLMLWSLESKSNIGLSQLFLPTEVLPVGFNPEDPIYGLDWEFLGVREKPPYAGPLPQIMWGFEARRGDEQVLVLLLKFETREDAKRCVDELQSKLPHWSKDCLIEQISIGDGGFSGLTRDDLETSVIAFHKSNVCALIGDSKGSELTVESIARSVSAKIPDKLVSVSPLEDKIIDWYKLLCPEKLEATADWAAFASLVEQEREWSFFKELILPHYVLEDFCLGITTREPSIYAFEFNQEISAHSFFRSVVSELERENFVEQSVRRIGDESAGLLKDTWDALVIFRKSKACVIVSGSDLSDCLSEASSINSRLELFAYA